MRALLIRTSTIQFNKHNKQWNLKWRNIWRQLPECLPGLKQAIMWRVETLTWVSEVWNTQAARGLTQIIRDKYVTKKGTKESQDKDYSGTIHVTQMKKDTLCYPSYSNSVKNIGPETRNTTPSPNWNHSWWTNDELNHSILITFNFEMDTRGQYGLSASNTKQNRWNQPLLKTVKRAAFYPVLDTL